MYWRWAPYVSVGQRREQAKQQMDKLRKKGVIVQPVVINGQTIARTFWGKAWCKHLETFSDFTNRLPRGRTYVRNGSICHLEIHKGKITAKISGSHLYDATVSIKTLPEAKWKQIRKGCAGQVGSMLELLQGRLSSQVMGLVIDPKEGLFPLRREIAFECSCPDWAEMCKHIAAVLYGVGARLDTSPELLFLLRGVDHHDLISTETAKTVTARGKIGKGRVLDKDSLADVFDIALEEGKPRKTTPKTARGVKAPKKAGRTKKKRSGTTAK